MRFADRLLLRAFALGSIALAGALLGAVNYFFDQPPVAIVLGIAFLLALPPAIGSLALWRTMRTMRSYNLDLGGLDPETYFCATANDPNLKSLVVLAPDRALAHRRDRGVQAERRIFGVLVRAQRSEPRPRRLSL